MVCITYLRGTLEDQWRHLLIAWHEAIFNAASQSQQLLHTVLIFAVTLEKDAPAHKSLHKSDRTFRLNALPKGHAVTSTEIAICLQRCHRLMAWQHQRILGLFAWQLSEELV